MKTSDYRASVFIMIIFLLSDCNTVEVSRADSLPARPVPAVSVLPKKDLNKIDLTRIRHVAPQGRVQDEGVLQDEDFNALPIVRDLLAHGKDSIPFLIDKLGDETEMDRSVISFWYRVYVGDIALVILSGFFTL